MFYILFDDCFLFYWHIPYSNLTANNIENIIIEPIWIPFRISWTYDGRSWELYDYTTEYIIIPIWPKKTN